LTCGVLFGCAQRSSKPAVLPPPRSEPSAGFDKEGRFIYAVGDFAVVIDPRVGGRVTSISLGGRNFLTGTDVDPDNYGSTFWTSPQSDWGWPPPPEIDKQPYAAKIADQKLILTGAASSKLGIAVTKTFSFDAATSSMTIEYAMTNQGSSPLTVAPWEITRAHTGGITFFPTGDATYDHGNKSLATQQSEGMTWFAYDAAAITADSKLFADGKDGFLAHVDGDTVLVKKFADVPTDQQAPKEGEIEIYANRAHTYIEIENQGPYAPLAPTATATWTIRWTLRKIPSDVEKTAGSASLAKWVRGIAAEL
jgi:hypothetical protein